MLWRRQGTDMSIIHDPHSTSAQIRPTCGVCYDLQLDVTSFQVQDLSAACHRCILLKALYDRLERSLIDEYPDFQSSNSSPGTDKEISLSSQNHGRVVAKFLWFRKRNHKSIKRRDPFFYRYIDIQCIDTVSISSLLIPVSTDQSRQAKTIQQSSTSYPPGRGHQSHQKVSSSSRASWDLVHQIMLLMPPAPHNRERSCQRGLSE